MDSQDCDVRYEKYTGQKNIVYFGCLMEKTTEIGYIFEVKQVK